MLEEKVNELVEEYGFSKKIVKKYLHLILIHPDIDLNDIEKIGECLEFAISERYSIYSTPNAYNKANNVSTTIDRAVKQIFGYGAINGVDLSFSECLENFLSNTKGAKILK